MNSNTNVVLDVICILSLVIMIFAICIIQKNVKKKDIVTKVFIMLMGEIIGVLIFDILGWVLNGSTFPGAIGLLYFVNTAYYAMQVIICWGWLAYVCFYVLKSKYSFLRIILYTSPLAILEFIVIIINFWKKWVFEITPEGVYIRGNFYVHNLIFLFMYIFAAIGIIIVSSILSRDYYHKKKCILLIIYAFLPILGGVIQSFSYGISLIWPFNTLTILMMFVTDQYERITNLQIKEALEREKRIKVEKELTDKNVLIMLSQIRPHFLYNTLTAISQLCDINPKVAKQATIDFSKYLRSNIDSIKETNLIPFETELQHIDKYLTLEKLRFEDDLRIIYDIKTSGFFVPPLSIQPLVENAVKYGACQKEEGGTVIIATREEKNYYKVIIKDDGDGFDTSKSVSDGRQHVGIENVRSRLRAMCKGTLDIDSKIGQGTIVTVSIPKGE